MAEEDFSKLPLEERCSHKNWKARVSAYDELTKTFKVIDNDKEWGKFGPLVRKFPTDSNAAAQEKALEVTLLFLENAALSQAGRIVGEVMNGVVNKCVTAAKAKSRELALDISLMCVEIEKFEVVQEQLMTGVEHKNPKVVAACVSIITEILRAFGPKVINAKVILKKIPMLTEDRDKTVRDETKKLLVELYRWLGPAVVKAQLSTVKPLVVQEVDAEVAKFTDKVQTTRLLRSQQSQEQRCVTAAEVGDEENDETGNDDVQLQGLLEVDPYDLLDPVDILSKLPKDFYEKVESKKWQERKEALEALEALVANPVLEAGDYADLVRTLKKMIAKDNNVVVVALAGKCLAGLAGGLKKKFSPYASSCVSTILEKFKEKKANVLTAMRDAIDACFVATSLEAVQEDVILALQNKNPCVKIETNGFLARVFAKTPFKIMSEKKLMKPFFIAILANLNESDASVREAAAEALGVAMRHLGERALGSLIADLEPIKLQKVKEFAEKAVITALEEKRLTKSVTFIKAKPSFKTANSDPNKPSKIQIPSSTTEVAVKSSTVTQRPASKTVLSAASRPNSVKTAPKAVAVAPKVVIEELIGSNLPVNQLKSQRISDEMKLKVLKWNFTTPREDFVDLLKELMAAAGISSTLISNMFNTNFKFHMKAVDTLHKELNLNPAGTMCNSDLILKWATIRFFDTNPSVLIRILEYLTSVFQILSTDQQGYSMSDVEANAFIPYLIGKLGDSKENIRASVHAILRLLVNVYTPQRIFSFILDGLKSKNARQRTDCLDELSYMIENHGMNVIMASQVALKEIAKQISDRDANVRNGALNCIVQAYYLQGDKVYKTIGTLAGKDLSLLEERIKRAGKSRPATSISSEKNQTPFVNNEKQTLPDLQIVSSESNQQPHEDTVENNLSSSIMRMGGNEFSLSQITPLLHTTASSTSYTSRCSILPEKYSLDFIAIDKMFTSDETLPPLELLDTNIENLSLSKQLQVPSRRAFVNGSTSAKSLDSQLVPSQTRQSIDLVVSTIGDSNLEKAIESCTELEAFLVNPETSPIMSGRIDTMLAMVCLQIRRQLGYLKVISASSEDLPELNSFFRSVVTLLTILFKNKFLSQNANKDSLRDILRHFVSCIADENLAKLRDSAVIIKLMNIMIVKIIENSDLNEITCALIRLLNDTISDGGSSSNLLELVLKCHWKLLKHKLSAQNENFDWDVNSILQEYHSFMKNHPIAYFKNRDATPLKTIKAIMQSLVMHAGCDTVHFYLGQMPDDMKDSEGGQYINKCIELELLKIKR